MRMTRSSRHDESTLRQRFQQQQPPMARNHTPEGQHRRSLERFSSRPREQGPPRRSGRSILLKLPRLWFRVAIWLLMMLPPVRALCCIWRSLRRCSCTTLHIARILLLWVLPAAIIVGCATVLALSSSLFVFGMLRFFYVPKCLLIFPIYFDYNYIEPPLPQLSPRPTEQAGIVASYPNAATPASRGPFRAFADAADVDATRVIASIPESRGLQPLPRSVAVWSKNNNDGHRCVHVEWKPHQHPKSLEFLPVPVEGGGHDTSLSLFGYPNSCVLDMQDARREVNDRTSFRGSTAQALRSYNSTCQEQAPIGESSECFGTGNPTLRAAPGAGSGDLSVLCSTVLMQRVARPCGLLSRRTIVRHMPRGNKSQSPLQLLFPTFRGVSGAAATSVPAAGQPEPSTHIGATRPTLPSGGTVPQYSSDPPNLDQLNGSPSGDSRTSRHSQQQQQQQPAIAAQEMANSILLTAMLDYADNSAQRTASLVDRAVGFVLLSNRSWEYTVRDESFVERCMKSRRAGKFFGVSAAGTATTTTLGERGPTTLGESAEAMWRVPDASSSNSEVLTRSLLRAASQRLLRLVGWPFCTFWKLNPLIWAATRVGRFWREYPQQSWPPQRYGEQVPPPSAMLVNHYVDISLVLHYEHFSSSNPFGCSKVFRKPHGDRLYHYSSNDGNLYSAHREVEPERRSVTDAVSRAIEDLLLRAPGSIDKAFETEKDRQQHPSSPQTFHADHSPPTGLSEEIPSSLEESGTQSTSEWSARQGRASHVEFDKARNRRPGVGVVAGNPVAMGWQHESTESTGSAASGLEQPIARIGVLGRKVPVHSTYEPISSCVSMISLELFDDQCRRVGRSRRPIKLTPTHWWARLVNSAVGKVLFPLARSRATAIDSAGAPLQEEKVSLVEGFWLSSVSDLKLARIELAPAFVVSRAELVLELQLTGLRRILRDRPIIALLILLPVWTSSLSCLFACCGIGAYARTLRTFRRRRVRRPGPQSS